MTIYKCEDCSHEVISNICPSECDICGGHSVVSLEKFLSRSSSEKHRAYSKPERHAPDKRAKKRASTSERKATESSIADRRVKTSAFVSAASGTKKSGTTGAVKAELRHSTTPKSSGSRSFPSHSSRSTRVIKRKRARSPGSYVALLLTGLISFGTIGAAINAFNTIPAEKNTSKEPDANPLPEEEVSSANLSQGCIGVRYAHLSELNIGEDEEPIEADVVLETLDDMPAVEEGIKAGDIITEINNQKSNDLSFMQDSVTAFAIGEKVPISILRPDSYKITELEENQLSFSSSEPYTELTFEVPTAPCPQN
ncbi:MAG: PDZ domain-containing protein [Cyanobacteria bacterium J06650_10]